MHTTPSFIVVGIFLLGGVSYSAESALPGDFLYPVKIYANEKTKGFIAVTDKMEAGFMVKSADHRLLEVEKLAEKNKLTKEALADLQNRFYENIKNFKEISQKMEEKDQKKASLVRSDMESVLDAHRELLKKKTGTNNASYGDNLKNLLVNMDKEFKNISEKRRFSEEKAVEGNATDAKSGEEDALRAAEKKIAEMQKILNSENGARGDVAGAKEKLKEAVAHLAEGKAKLDIPAYEDAFALFRRAEREAVSAKLIFNGTKQ
jgi:hypothetical protein